MTLVGVLALGIMEGILIGVVFSLILLLRALAFPPDAVLGRTPDGGWHDPAHRPDAVPVPGLLVYRFSAPLFFANCGLFRDRIEALVDAAPQPVTGVVVDGGAIHDVDLMACEMLVELDSELRRTRHHARLRQPARPRAARHRARPVAGAGRGRRRPFRAWRRPPRR